MPRNPLRKWYPQDYQEHAQTPTKKRAAATPSRKHRQTSAERERDELRALVQAYDAVVNALPPDERIRFTNALPERYREAKNSAFQARENAT